MTAPAQAVSALRLRYIVTICSGSFLLFLVQPMIARMALPRLGGAPAVWNSAMLVYQALLLAGYGYAHWLGRFAVRRQALIHLAFFALAALMLPIGLSGASPPANASPAFWVPWLLLSSIGPLFLVVSAQAPLMQRWFAQSGGGDPYPLYAASNLGSFGGLLAYPLIVEPLLPIAGQRWLWSAGYALVMLFVAICALALPRGGAVRVAVNEDAPLPRAREWGWWILLAAVPSGLMLSTSLHLTTDIVAMPLLWVLPLGLYLLSFSFAFSEHSRVAALMKQIAPLFMLMAGGIAFADSARAPLLHAGLGLLLLFVVAVALHGEMFARRPAPAHLTRFYLAMSIGGVLGGLFGALVAPLVFDWGYEHPILIIAAAALVGQTPLFERGALLWARHGTRLTRWLPPLGLLASLVAGGYLLRGAPVAVGLGATALIIMLGLLAIGRRIMFALLLGALMLAQGGWLKLQMSMTPGMMTRSYFGIYTVLEDGARRNLIHGTTVHGVQMKDPARAWLPNSYYAPRSGIGLALQAAPALFGAQARIDIVGLGAGTLACYAQPGQRWRFYEIDPAIAVIARDQTRFSFLSHCTPNAEIAIGDARLVLAEAKAGDADLLAIDAFSSDSVPIHLLTREAFLTYARRLAPNGLLLIHISNRHLDLEPVLAAAARDAGWAAQARLYRASEQERALGYATSQWIAMAKDPAQLMALRDSNRTEPWRSLHDRAGFALWSDDHASILSVIKALNRD